MIFMLRHIKILILSILVMTASLPVSYAQDAAEAEAGEYYMTLSCIGDEKDYYTRAIVDCIKNPVKSAVLDKENGLLKRTSSAMLAIVSALTTLAIVILGIRVATGNAGSLPRVIPLAIRAGLVLTLLTGSITYAEKMFTVFDEVIAIASPSGFSPWIHIDKFISEFLGFTKSSGDGSLKDGIIGLLNGSVFAKSFGFMLSIIGICAVGSLIVFIISTLYVYLASFIAFSLLLIITPILLPFFIFTYTEGYFIKWFNLLLSTIITPMLLLGVLSIFLVTQAPIPVSTDANPTLNKECKAGMAESQCNRKFNGQPIPERAAIFPSILKEIMDKLGSDYMKKYYYTGNSFLPAQIMQTDRNEYNFQFCMANQRDAALCEAAINKSNAPFSSNINPYFTASINYSPGYYSVIDFGSKHEEMHKFLVKKFFELLIFTLLMNSIVAMIPSISASIAGGVSTGVANISTPLKEALSKLSNR